ncbi:hypothetical protein [Mycobacterium kyorinense]|uniref:hypothetical protein n=1 Tax=Mycobacterium kyorinense TaxID=487514 RepID=UPI001E605275|nr:hypothetical protein [Mycobacterium kyorinense]
MSSPYEAQYGVFKERIPGSVPHVRLYASVGSASRALTGVVGQPAHGLAVAREVAFPLLAVALIVAYCDVRIPLGLPGHRGLVWLTLLVMVVVVTSRRETVIAVGAASTLATSAIGAAAGPCHGGQYVAAAVLLYAVAAVGAVRRRRWLLALSAAPIHLVALASSVVALLGRGQLFTFASVGMAERVAFHLTFGLIAGLLAWTLVCGMERAGGIRRKE